MRTWTAETGAPFRLGATWIEQEQAYDFALYSKHAESVTLLFYGRDEFVRPLLSYPLDYLKNKSGRVWHCRISKAALRGAVYYGYRVEGPPPQSRFEWHAFDPDKILLDPYAESVFFPFPFDRRAAARPGSNAGQAPLAVLEACQHQADTIIYELHVRGFTMHPSSGVSSEKRGTYAALVDDFYLMINASPQSLTFALQDGEASDWKRVIDTSHASPDDFCEPGKETPLASPSHELPPRSIAVFLRSRQKGIEP